MTMKEKTKSYLKKEFVFSVYLLEKKIWIKFRLTLVRIEMWSLFALLFARSQTINP